MRHEMHLALRGMRAVGATLPFMLAAAAIWAGAEAALSAALGAGVVVLNQALAVASTAWSRVLGPKVFATGYAGWILRMAGVLAAMSYFSRLAWVDKVSLAISFCAALAVLLGAECVSYVRRSYVPAWRMAR